MKKLLATLLCCFVFVFAGIVTAGGPPTKHPRHHKSHMTKHHVVKHHVIKHQHHKKVYKHRHHYKPISCPANRINTKTLW